MENQFTFLKTQSTIIQLDSEAVSVDGISDPLSVEPPTDVVTNDEQQHEYIIPDESNEQNHIQFDSNIDQPIDQSPQIDSTTDVQLVNDSDQLADDVAISEATQRYPRRKRQRPDFGPMLQTHDLDHESVQPYLFMTTQSDVQIPESYGEALRSKQAQHWQDAIRTELNSMKQNDVWSFEEQPKDFHPITTRWVFTYKPKPSAGKSSYGARLCCRGFDQLPEIQFDQTYSPTMKYKSLKLLIAISFQYHYKMKSLDFKRAFLNTKLDHVIHIEAPDGVQCPANQVIRLNKGLYGLKQASYLWNTMIDTFLKNKLQFNVTQSDPCIYTKTSSTNHSNLPRIIC